MRSRRARAVTMAGILVGCGALMTGCAWWSGPTESLAERAARITPALLAVPGVTGGSLTVKDASLSHLYECALTSDAGTTDELKAILVDALQTLAREASDDRPGSLVSCTVSNATEGVGSHQVGLTNPTSLRAIRDELG